MPTLISKHQVASLESAVKKTYTTITNGFHMIAMENGGDLRYSGLFDDIDDATFSDRMDKAVKEHFKVIKTCKIGDTENCPVREFPSLKNYVIRDYLLNPNSQYVFYLSDGSQISISNSKCVPTAYKDESNYKYTCAGLAVDTNGFKGPNVLGKDVFQFGNLDEKGNIYPHTGLEWAKANYGPDNAISGAYWRVETSQCGDPETKLEEQSYVLGQNCLARIMEMGWQMDYLK